MLIKGSHRLKMLRIPVLSYSYLYRNRAILGVWPKAFEIILYLPKKYMGIFF